MYAFILGIIHKSIFKIVKRGSLNNKNNSQIYKIVDKKMIIVVRFKFLIEISGYFHRYKHEWLRLMCDVEQAKTFARQLKTQQ